jgi:hypothetical protein
MSDPVADLTSDRAAFLAEVRSLGEAAMVGPEGGGWSPSQVAQHLMLAEEGFLAALTAEKPLAGPRIRDRVGALAVWFVFRLGLRVSIPTPRVDPTPPLPLREVDARWTTVGDRLDALLRERGREAPDRPLVRHPVAGPMDQRRLVAFLRAHIRHHRRQLERIREGD